MLAASSVVIGSVDACIVVAYLVATILLGIWLGRGQKNNREYFLGGHQLPTWSLLLSIVATETSTVTFLSVPGLSYIKDRNFTFLQLAFGYIVGRMAIIVFLLPGYFRGEMLSAYEVLGQRFGLATRRLASLVFLVMRNLADGLRLLLSAMALKLAIDLNVYECIIVMTIITAVYCCAGGVRSVVWNDCIQFAVYMAGAFATVWVIVHLVSGGWGQIVQFGHETGRWQVFDFDPSLTKKTVTFWSGLVGGAFLTLATHGADQMIVQRYLCAKNQKSASWALGISGFIVLGQFALFLTIGLALACFYSVHDTASAPTSGDQVFMTFVVQHMGTGLTGLILAAILAATMSNLSSSFNSSASVFMSDWLQRWLPTMADRESLRLARWLTLMFAGLHALVAITAYKMAFDESTVNMVLGIAGFSTGLLLGLYFLGLIAPNTREAVAIVAFFVGLAVTCGVAFGTRISWCWYTLIGSMVVVIVGIVLGIFFKRPASGSPVASYHRLA
ncbi:MAG TPA: sodium:solute symporter [Lacipirellulaceae bacterium]|nr:sodium:solute symporter [Lacipirellulaceae bacterium]